MYSLSATAADELAAESKELGHSILTYTLLAGLKAVDGGALEGSAVHDQARRRGRGGMVSLRQGTRARPL